jgi:thioredoxin 1
MNITLLLFAIGGGFIGGLAHAFVTSQGSSKPLRPTLPGSLLGGVIGVAVGFMALGSGGGSSPASTGHLEHVETIAAFQEKVLDADNTVLVDFYATWCPPCRLLAPELEKLHAKELAGFNIVKVDVDKAKELSQKYNIKSIPTMMLFKDGKVVKNWVGMKTADELTREITPILKES